ncbi:hypothetical protein [Massilia rhizosphaerae]|uniref:hypothetical protein n=1 Tax=Massilia rhizosphaerae TaxID=2784389 RepID=UPI0018DDA0D3|nr:hypothetical protein [Massilia rhizosphaerae]
MVGEVSCPGCVDAGGFSYDAPASTTFHNCVGNAAGASGLKNAESWMYDVVT